MGKFSIFNQYVGIFWKWYKRGTYLPWNANMIVNSDNADGASLKVISTTQETTRVTISKIQCSWWLQ